MGPGDPGACVNWLLDDGEEGAFDLRLVGQEALEMNEDLLAGNENLHEQHGEDVLAQHQVGLKGKAS